MTRSELVSRLSLKFTQLVYQDAELAVNEILMAMSKNLAIGNRIEIRNFGSFAVRYRPSREGRNPKSGQKVLIPEKCALHFKAGKTLKDRVKNLQIDHA